MRHHNDSCGCGIEPNSSCGVISTNTTKCKTVVAVQPYPDNGCNPQPYPHVGNGCGGPITPMLSPLTTAPSYPTVTVENLLSLIEHKCDKATCDLVQHEIDHIYAVLNILKPTTLPDPDKDKKPGITTGVVITPSAFQLIANMTESLQGDLTDKYPSATLLKTELMKLWQCLYNKQQHHGTWDTNFVVRDLLHPEDEECLIDGDPASIGNQLKVIVPVDVGSTVFHTIDGRRCLFESLVDNNITEPSKMAVLDGLWLNYCDIKDAIDCVLPREKLVDCTTACLDLNGDGVVEYPTLCERVTAIESNTDKYIDKFEYNSVSNAYEVTLNDGTKLTANANTALDLPAGAITFANGINGTFNIKHDGNPTWTADYVDTNGVVIAARAIGFYEFLSNTKTFDPADYPYLAVAGRKLVISGVASIGYYTNFANKAVSAGMATQWDTQVTVDGVKRKAVGDSYALNTSGYSSGLADNFSFTIITTGNPIVIDFCYVLVVNTTSGVAIGDILAVDMSAATLTFAADIH